MPSVPVQNRVKKLREARKALGERETNVWMPAEVQEAIDRAVVEGKFPNRRIAIIHALKAQFTETTM